MPQAFAFDSHIIAVSDSKEFSANIHYASMDQLDICSKSGFKNCSFSKSQQHSKSDGKKHYLAIKGSDVNKQYNPQKIKTLHSQLKAQGFNGVIFIAENKAHLQNIDTSIGVDLKITPVNGCPE